MPPRLGRGLALVPNACGARPARKQGRRVLPTSSARRPCPCARPYQCICMFRDEPECLSSSLCGRMTDTGGSPHQGCSASAGAGVAGVAPLAAREARRARVVRLVSAGGSGDSVANALGASAQAASVGVRSNFASL